MRSVRWIWLSILAWIGVWLFWLVTTRGFHPTFILAVIVTTSLIGVYAAATYVNHLILIPRFWRTGRLGRYTAWLVVTMLLLTAAALWIIRASYAQLWGLDPDKDGVYKHFAIDLFGMAVHLSAAAVIVWAFRRVGGRTESARTRE
jgi:hypothetical protein